MKKLLFALSALAALTLLAPAPGSAYDNIMAMAWELPASADDEIAASLTGVAPFSTPTLHVFLLNATVSGVYGYEFGYTVGGTGTAMVVSTTLMGSGPIDVGGGPGNHIVGLAAPMPITYATLLTSLGLFYQSMGGEDVTFTLHGATPNSVLNGLDLPSLLGPSDLIVQCGTSAVTYVDDSPVPAVTASLNGEAPVSVDQASWDSVKSLFR